MKNLVILIWAALLSSSAFAQKNNETSAAIEYNKFKEQVNKMLMGGNVDFVSMQSIIKKAKEYIDLAAANETTKSSPKTLFFKGEIYTGHLIAFATDTVFAKSEGENYMNTGLEAYKQSLTISSKFKDDIQESIIFKKQIFGMGIDLLYKQEKYGEAAEAYELQVKLSDAMMQVDTVSMFNAGLCYEKNKDFENAARMYKQCAAYNYNAPDIYTMLSYSYRSAGNISEAENTVVEGRKKFPFDQGLIREIVNNKIALGDNEGAETALNEAIAGDPNNKELYYVIGTIYSESKKFDKAEEALLKSLEIDPNYDKSLYNLGAILVSWAGNVQDEANKLGYKHPEYNGLLDKANEIYKRAVPPLDKYVNIKTDDIEVLTLLWQICRNLEDTAKADEYKKRIDALKNK
jgi:Flp pilus assembly protein TadD